MIRHQTVVVAGKPVQNPVRGGYVRIIVRTVYAFGVRLVPARPRGPVEILSVEVRRHLVRLVVEKAFADTELLEPILVLQAPPEHAIHELLKLIQLIFVRRAELLHDPRDPRASASFVAESGNPRAAVLHDD